MGEGGGGGGINCNLGTLLSNMLLHRHHRKVSLFSFFLFSGVCQAGLLLHCFYTFLEPRGLLNHYKYKGKKRTFYQEYCELLGLVIWKFKQ